MPICAQASLAAVGHFQLSCRIRGQEDLNSCVLAVDPILLGGCDGPCLLLLELLMLNICCCRAVRAAVQQRRDIGGTNVPSTLL